MYLIQNIIAHAVLDKEENKIAYSEGGQGVNFFLLVK